MVEDPGAGGQVEPQVGVVDLVQAKKRGQEEGGQNGEKPGTSLRECSLHGEHYPKLDRCRMGTLGVSLVVEKRQGLEDPRGSIERERPWEIYSRKGKYFWISKFNGKASMENRFPETFLNPCFLDFMEALR